MVNRLKIIGLAKVFATMDGAGLRLFAVSHAFSHGNRRIFERRSVKERLERLTVCGSSKLLNRSSAFTIKPYIFEAENGVF